MQKRLKRHHKAHPTIKPTTAAMPAPSVPKQNVVTYMAGCLIRKYPIDNCSTYSDLLKVENLPKISHVTQYELLRFKTYKETHCLIYQSIGFSNFVLTMETFFCSIFGGVIHQNDLLRHCEKLLKKTSQNCINVASHNAYTGFINVRNCT